MQYQLWVVLTASFTAGMLAVSGCSTQPPAPAHGSIQALPFSVVATGESAADLQSASTFAWAGELQQTGHEKTSGNESMDALLQAAIRETLQAKGYRYSSVPGEGDLLVSYHVAMDTAHADLGPSDPNELPLQPSLNITSPDPTRYEKGTLVIEVTEKSTGLTAWRSALQGFTMRDLSDAERRQRVGQMVDRMLAGMPAK
jgi:hypothetical protein